MYETNQLLLPTKAKKVFNIFLLFYPGEYRMQFGNEMRIVFAEMYQEELEKKEE